MTEKKKKFLSKTELLQQIKRKPVEFRVYALDAYVHLQGLSPLQMVAISDKDSEVDQTKDLLRLGIVDEDGNPLLDDAGISELLDGDAEAVGEIAIKLRDLSGATAEVQEQAAKN